MDFALTKIASFFVLPSNLMLAVLAGGILLSRTEKWRAFGLRLAALGLIVLLVAGFLPLGNMLLAPLEERFGDRQPEVPTEPVTGIILLGGFEDGWVTAGRGGLAINESAERLTEGVRLARRLPNARLIFSGGIGSLFGAETVEEPIRRFLIDAGIEDSRVAIETKSRNTSENASFTRDLANPRPGQRWVLVTSAYHMPRSVGYFRRAGFDVIPYPTDFRLRDASDVLRPFSSAPDGWKRLDLAVREWTGLFAAYWRGTISDVLPGP